MYDFLIIGGGPAAAAAGIYAARKKLKTILIAKEWGGQSVVSSNIENWIGTKNVSGIDFAKMLENHVRAQEDIEIVAPDKVATVEKINENFRVSTEKGNSYETRAVFVGSGARRRKLGVPGEKEFDGKGVSYCSTCDAPLFQDKSVAVIGGGNAGLETVLDLVPYAKNIWLLEYADALKGDFVTQEKVRAAKNVEDIIFNAETLEILGDKPRRPDVKPGVGASTETSGFVNGIRYKDRKSGDEERLNVQGVFVEIGSVPNSDIVKGLVKTNEHGEIIIDSKTGRTSQKGIWAAGDVTDDPFKQNNISAGDAVKAALDAYNYLMIGDR